MARITTSLLLILNVEFFIESLPIKNGFSVKFKPLFTKDEIHPKTFGSLFAKISQDFTPEAVLRQQIFSKAIPPPSPELGTGCSNQVARMLLPTKYQFYDDNETQSWGTAEYFNLPIIKQPFVDYNVLVATAPPNIKIGRGEDSKNVVIYVVFNKESSEADGKSGTLTMPEIYFVNKQNVNFEAVPTDKPKLNPIFIVNNNRTVTGLKSKQVEKFLKFRNSLKDRYNYDVLP